MKEVLEKEEEKVEEEREEEKERNHRPSERASERTCEERTEQAGYMGQEQDRIGQGGGSSVCSERDEHTYYNHFLHRQRRESMAAF